MSYLYFIGEIIFLKIKNVVRGLVTGRKSCNLFSSQVEEHMLVKLGIHLSTIETTPYCTVPVRCGMGQRRFNTTANVCT